MEYNCFTMLFSFCCITKWISYTYTYIPISPPFCLSLPPSLSHPSGGHKAPSWSPCSMQLLPTSRLLKEGSSTICNNMDESWGYYVSEISQAQKDKYLYEHSKVVKSIKSQNVIVVARSWGKGEMGIYWSTGIKLCLSKMSKL